MTSHLRRGAFTLILILVPLVAMAMPTGAQSTEGPQDVIVLPGDMVITDNQTWNESKEIPGLLFIRGNASLTIVGATVKVGQLGVEPNGRLTLISQPGAPAKMAASSAGWRGLMAGTLDVQGLPDAPAVIDGNGGSANRNENNVIFQGGFYLSGNSTASHLVFSNYTSGLYVSHGGRLVANDITIDSRRGMGLIVADGRANLTDATFKGTAGVFVTRLGRIGITNGTFDFPQSAVVTSAIEARFKDVKVAHTTYCFEIYGGVVSIDGLECTDFRRAGIRATLTLPLRYSTIDIANARISTPNASAGEGHGIFLDSITNASITDTTIGPLPGNGLLEMNVAPKIQNLTITGAGLYGEVMVDPPMGTTLAPHYNGTSGGNGWFEAKWEMHPQVLLSNGSAAPNATVIYYIPGNKTPLQAQTVNTLGVPKKGPILRGTIVIPNRTQLLFPYEVEARSEDGNETATLTFIPNGTQPVLQLRPIPPPTPPKPAPGPGIPLVAIAVALTAACWRKTRRS